MKLLFALDLFSRYTEHIQCICGNVQSKVRSTKDHIKTGSAATVEEVLKQLI